MAIFRPFAALRPKPELAARICELPYDVLSTEEARRLAEGNPLSFLRVSKPEIDLPPGTSPYDTAVYAQGRQNFARLIEQGALLQDARPCFYCYRQIMGAHAQIGLVGVASCQEYLDQVIKRHELTRPDKEDDRLRHIETLAAQTGPAFLVYRTAWDLDDLIRRKTAARPEIDFVSTDGVRHTAWAVDQPGDLAFIEAAFARLPALYIADGHHRSAAAARVFRQRNGAGTSPWFLAVAFPHHQMQILPYNRLLRDLNGLSPEELLRRLESVGSVHRQGGSQPAGMHEVAFYLNGRWGALRFRPQLTNATDPLERLDVALLQRHVLGPIFGIDDPRTSQRIEFVGGIRGTEELEQRVQRGEFACAFSLFPTRMEELMSVADRGGIMPPKSTWFEPKLRDGMFCHLLEG